MLHNMMPVFGSIAHGMNNLKHPRPSPAVCGTLHLVPAVRQGSDDRHLQTIGFGALGLPSSSVRDTRARCRDARAPTTRRPTDSAERRRIEGAGGSVSAQGRVEDNLGLSRAIGDLAYKRDEARPPTLSSVSRFFPVLRYLPESYLAAWGAQKVVPTAQRVQIAHGTRF